MHYVCSFLRCIGQMSEPSARSLFDFDFERMAGGHGGDRDLPEAEVPHYARAVYNGGATVQ